MSNIPEARITIEEALEINAKVGRLLRAALPQLDREKPVRKAPATSRRVTDKVAAQIRHLAATTSLSQQEIALAVGVTGGRVSEVIRGLR